MVIIRATHIKKVLTDMVMIYSKSRLRQVRAVAQGRKKNMAIIIKFMITIRVRKTNAKTFIIVIKVINKQYHNNNKIIISAVGRTVAPGHEQFRHTIIILKKN